MKRIVCMAIFFLPLLAGTYGVSDRMQMSKKGGDTFPDNALGRYLRSQFDNFNQNLTKWTNRIPIMPRLVQRYVDSSIHRVENALLRLANEPVQNFNNDVKAVEQRILRILESVQVVSPGEHPTVDRYAKLVGQARSAVISALSTIEAIRNASQHPSVQNIFRIFTGVRNPQDTKVTNSTLL